MSILESGLRGRIISALRRRDDGRCWLVHGNPASAFTGRGRSDLTVCAEGLFIVLEVKPPGELPTPPQKRYLLQVRQAGGVGAVVHSPQEAIIVVQGALNARRNRQA